jgi:peptidoglycan hydrolase-like protein with peptidoglycan-binding domain
MAGQVGIAAPAGRPEDGAMMAVERNDQGPLVVTMQVLLNRLGESPIGIDGHFGPETQEAVRQYQSQRRLKVSGNIDDVTWQSMADEAHVCAIDAVDIYDPTIEGPTHTRAAGPGLITTGGASNGLAAVVSRIAEKAANQGNVAVLRFIGHGGYGAMGVSAGSRSLRDSEGRTLFRWTGRGAGPYGLEHHTYGIIKPGSKPNEPEYLNAVEVDPWLHRSSVGFRPRGKHDSASIYSAQLDSERELRRIQHLLEPYATIELHGCMTAAGRRGEISLTRMARIIGRPVCAGTSYQKWGSRENLAPRLEPPIRCFFPQGLDLRRWAQRFRQLPSQARSGSGTAGRKPISQ